MVDALPFLAIDVGLLVLAWRRPWVGLVALVAGLPFNGILTQVLPVALTLSSPAHVAVGAWHDALLGGILLAAAVELARTRRRPPLVTWLVTGMVVVGAVFVLASPVRLTALYAFRVLYEPPLLLAGLLVLAAGRPAPAWVLRAAGLGFVAATAAGAVFTWLQVYVFRYRYLQVYYTDPGAQIHHSYLARGINQPRGIGFLTSPNEFGAVLAIAILMVCVPSLLPLGRRARAWTFVALGLALILSFSRSGMLAALVGVAVVAWLARSEARGTLAGLRTRGVLRDVFPPFAVGAFLLALIVATSGAPKLVQATVSGSEPSAAGRGDSIRAGLSFLRDNPLGLGLGTAGPKAARFGETDGRPRILTETWYVLYAIQVGVFGLLLLGATALVLFRELWRSRRGPPSTLALAIGLGLGVGAVFIPIIEEPTVWTPLWAFTALALLAAGASSERASRTNP